MALYKINQERFEKVISLYFLWKELNSKIKEDYSRGINLPEALTEPICCYVNDFLLSIPSKNTGKKKDEDQCGSEDAINPLTGEHVQIKGSSNWNSDLTSFGPRSNFTSLHFVRLNQDEDRMFLYNIPIDDLKNVLVNRTTTFAQMQAAGKRPRFSIIAKYINLYNIEPYAYVDLRTKEIFKRNI